MCYVSGAFVIHELLRQRQKASQELSAAAVVKMPKPTRRRRSAQADSRSCDFTAHLCTGIIHENYKLFVNPLFKTNQFCTYR